MTFLFLPGLGPRCGQRGRLVPAHSPATLETRVQWIATYEGPIAFSPRVYPFRRPIVLIPPPSSLPFPQSTSSRISSDMGANLSLLYPSVLVSIAGSLLWLKAHLFHSSRPPLPPGPKGKPIVGNMLDLPKSGQVSRNGSLAGYEIFEYAGSVKMDR